MLNHDQNAALSELEAHPQWPERACARTSLLGEPLVDPDLFFTPGSHAEGDAKRVCFNSCPLLVACRVYALGGDGWWESDGVWGGMTVAERRAERRAAKKRRARMARRGARPTPVANWKPSTAQRALLQALAAQPDLRAAAAALEMPFPNTRWVYSQMCEQLGFYPDELSVLELLEAAARPGADTDCVAEPLRAAA